VYTITNTNRKHETKPCAKYTHSIQLNIIKKLLVVFISSIISLVNINFIHDTSMIMTTLQYILLLKNRYTLKYYRVGTR